MSPADFNAILPEVVLAVYAMIALLVAVYTGKDRLASALTWGTAALFVLAALWIATAAPVTNEAFGGNFAAAFATAPPEVQGAYNDAVTFFTGQDPEATPRGKAKKHINGWHSTLAAFNEGNFPGWPHCDENTESEVNEFARRLGVV